MVRSAIAVAALLLCAGCLAKDGASTLMGTRTAAHEDGGPVGGADSGSASRDASDPCSASDRDGDGFGVDPSCPVIDCDDGNAAIFPGAPEACNAIDDDCNGQIDDGLGSGTCGTGACMRVVPNCMNGQPVACSAGSGASETCNGVDDDCDGVVDNGVAGPSCGVGACMRSAACTNGHLEACTPGEPSMESCNRSDDNCDGTVDEGFRANVVTGSYMMLRAIVPQCDGSGQRMGLECNTAIHRWCAGEGCTTTGFGPLENSDDSIVLGCVAAEPSVTVPYATLAAIHPACDGAGERIGPDCNAAIHRWCASMGYASGFGPVETTADAATVSCVRLGAATVVNTTYTVLASHHSGCNGGSPDARLGLACNAAINRFCASMGFVTGYGPVENANDDATVTCVSL
jgi:putative metal-binding protein